MNKTTVQKESVIKFLEEFITTLDVTKEYQSFHVTLESKDGDTHSFHVRCQYTKKVPVKGRKWFITKERY